MTLRDLDVSGNRGVGVWLGGVSAQLSGLRISNTGSLDLPGRDGTVASGDGLVVENSERFDAHRDATIAVESTSVTGSARYGLLMIGDRWELRGEIDTETVGACIDNGSSDIAKLGGGLPTSEGGTLESTEISADKAPIPVWTR